MSHKPNHPNNNPSPGPHKDRSKEETTKRHVYVESGVEIDLVQNFREKYEAAQGENAAHNKRILFWSKVGSGLILIYVAITAIQACLLRQSIIENTKQFKADQRPYISVQDFCISDGERCIDDTKVGYGFEIGKPLEVNIGLKNTGKTTALNVITHRHILFGASVYQVIKSEPPDENRNGTTVNSQTEQGTTATSIIDTYRSDSGPIPTSDITNWDGSKPILVFGRVTYYDRYGALYCTPFLMERVDNNWMRINELHHAGIQTMNELCPHGEP